MNRVILGVYGSLRSFHHNHAAMGLRDAGIYIDTLRIPNLTMYSCASYFPCVTEEKGNSNAGVVMEFYEIPSSLLDRLDVYEGYDPKDVGNSLFVRKTMIRPDGQKFEMYLWGGSTKGLTELESGDWIHYFKENV
jgi:gamma-glutamylcyclotransferase (GGCT)/AIG2-like uncharacterized protein YtfP